MRIAEVIGKVTLSTCHPSLDKASWKLGVFLSREGINGKAAGRSEPFILFDELGATDGSVIAVSEGAEAAAPFHPDTNPIDAYNAAMLDNIEVQ